jgi:hypothetical protein
MQNHLHEFGISVGGFLATAGLELSGLSRWLTISVGVATAIYTVLKIWLVCIEIKHKRKKYESRPNN